MPATPLRWHILVADPHSYRVGMLDWLASNRVVMDRDEIPRNDTLPEARAAALTPVGRTFLGWSRFPYFVVQPRGDSTLVRLVDARYGSPNNDSWAAMSVVVPAGASPDSTPNSRP
jgi:hypothetical protein